MPDTFCKAPHTLLQAKHIISRATGERLTFNAQDKILWVWMKDRHDHFKRLGNDWFDNQADIAYACSCDLSTVKRFIAKMTTHSYLMIEKRRIHGCAFSNSMIITHDLILAPVAPYKAIPKPVVAVVAPEHERVPEYAPIALPNVAKPRPAPALKPMIAPPVQDLDDDDYDDPLPWMRGAA